MASSLYGSSTKGRGGSDASLNISGSQMGEARERGE